MTLELTGLQAVILALSETTTTTTLPNTCDEGWQSFNGHCYLLVRGKKTWDDASIFCGSKGSYLIEITTDEDFEFVAELMRYVLLDKFWIGAKDRDVERKYVYQHSKQQVPDKYWRKGEPNDYNGEQHCAAMNSYNGLLELYDNGCNWNRWFVCEIP